MGGELMKRIIKSASVGLKWSNATQATIQAEKVPGILHTHMHTGMPWSQCQSVRLSTVRPRWHCIVMQTVLTWTKCSPVTSKSNAEKETQEGEIEIASREDPISF